MAAASSDIPLSGFGGSTPNLSLSSYGPLGAIFNKANEKAEHDRLRTKLQLPKISDADSFVAALPRINLNLREPGLGTGLPAGEFRTTPENLPASLLWAWERALIDKCEGHAQNILANRSDELDGDGFAMLGLLFTRYQHTSSTTLFLTLDKTMSCTMNNSEKADDYRARFSKLLNDLVRCGLDLPQTVGVMLFLRALLPKYERVREAFRGTNPSVKLEDSTLDTVVTACLEEDNWTAAHNRSGGGGGGGGGRPGRPSAQAAGLSADGGKQQFNSPWPWLKQLGRDAILGRWRSALTMPTSGDGSSKFWCPVVTTPSTSGSLPLLERTGLQTCPY
jgi:hypothetical protein